MSLIMVMMPHRSKPLSSIILTMGGVILMGLGLYFIFIRPPVLPEDPRYMGTTLEQIQVNLPGLLVWLKRVFWVMGGFMFASGLLTCHVAVTSFRSRTTGAAWIVAGTGLASIGLMSVVNFIIASDFKWLIFIFTLPWVVSLALYAGEADDSTKSS
ncbi:hypothetical protein RY831_02940 [Noviherbaspirillum sp. CPCC 100848]|uniref:Transmembrane protein n=1 Tax=Noviherbaspirillum album TaxID=3080276 RepID=A0ABU6J437_9BURK|nr:hypothetical protein [Noviherbaspirillum sp. CPCC 100848]MEC4718092.1 hypothetical protein [Noviherbaspirillum sp. CPCC 100848]